MSPESHQHDTELETECSVLYCLLT